MSTRGKGPIRTTLSRWIAAFRRGGDPPRRISLLEQMSLVPPEVTAAHMVESRGVADSLKSAASVVGCFERISGYPPSGLSMLDAIMAEYFPAKDIPAVLVYYRAVEDVLKAMDTERTAQGVPQ